MVSITGFEPDARLVMNPLDQPFPYGRPRQYSSLLTADKIWIVFKMAIGLVHVPSAQAAYVAGVPFEERAPAAAAVPANAVPSAWLHMDIDPGNILVGRMDAADLAHAFTPCLKVSEEPICSDSTNSFP
jgi:hypothetical protein